jgi:myo-inositol-1(or 4)-monophosphatase
MTTRSATLNVMIRAADKAARQLRRDFGEIENLQVSKKGPADFVSTADTAAENIIREELLKARPDYGFIMEEAGTAAGNDKDERCWVVDPLDGTSNFLHGLPHWAISIALAERGSVLAGIVLDPIKNELFHAEKGTGAFLNDRRIRASSRRRLNECLIATGAPYHGHGDRGTFVREIDAVMAATAGIRRWGSISPMWRPGAMMDIGSATFRHGTSPRVSPFCVKRAAWLPPSTENRSVSTVPAFWPRTSTRISHWSSCCAARRHRPLGLNSIAVKLLSQRVTGLSLRML